MDTVHNESITQTLVTVRQVRDTIAAARFPLLTGSADAAREQARTAVTQLDDYILPKLATLDAPLTVVVGGSTGAGKSTLVNTLIGEPVTRSGAIRPTTRQPVLLHRPEDAASFTPERLLPNLVRVPVTPGEALPGASPHGEQDELVTVPVDSLPAGIALIDAPDFDSVSDENRRLSQQLLRAADLWLFVTTANRYADAVPWEILRQAAARDITIAVLLNRVPEGAENEIEADLTRMLTEAGITPALIHSVTEQERDERGLLPSVALTPLIFWLRSLGADSSARSEIARRTLEGAVRSVAAQTSQLAEAAQEQQDAELRLRADVTTAFERALSNVKEATQDGQMLRGEVLSRWQDFVGTGEFFRQVETTVGRVRDRIAGFFRGTPPTRAVEVEQALEVGLHSVIMEEAAAAAETAQRRWLDDRAGRALLAGDDLAALDATFSEEVAESIRAWQQDVMDIIAAEGAGKRQRARFMSLGVNVTAIILMVAVFSMTGGLTGLEVGIAGGSGVVGQKLLEAIFGEDAVRRMAAGARTRLEDRVTELLTSQQSRFTNLLDTAIYETEAEHTMDAPDAEQLRASSASLETAGLSLSTTAQPAASQGQNEQAGE
ncbi:dynamin family protein [Rothia nasisuis]|uniref:dynamin family protein n=1 Tax=Rothia nasisuis TaxID=2109647 RepID=UPI003F6B20F8